MTRLVPAGAVLAGALALLAGVLLWRAEGAAIWLTSAPILCF